MSGSDRPIVIVGAAAAGIAAAEALRRGGWAGELVLVEEDPDAPYDRPPLSKQLLSGAWPPERLALLTPQRVEALAAHLRLGTRAVALDVASRTIALDTGETLAFEQLVIATGAAPRRLPGDELDGVCVLRTLRDALALRERLAGAPRLVVVGAGFLGLEVAATAVALGARVTVVEPVAAPLATRLGEHVAARLLALHAAHGVEVLTGVDVASLESDEHGHVRHVALGDGRRLAADVVLVAVGCAPSVAWLAGSGLELEDGVVCDERCRAADGVWAAGDVARWRHAGAGRLLRIEHRVHAAEQGRAVAAAILGAPAPFTPTPFFWTDHYDVKVQLAGFLPSDAEVEVADGDADGERFALLLRRRPDGAPVGVIGWNMPRAVTRLRAELALSPAAAPAW